MVIVWKLRMRRVAHGDNDKLLVRCRWGNTNCLPPCLPACLVEQLVSTQCSGLGGDATSLRPGVFLLFWGALAKLSHSSAVAIDGHIN